MPPKFQLFGLLPPKLRDTLFRPTNGTPLRGTTRFEPSLFQIRHTVRHNTCLRNKKGKKDSVKLAIRPDHPCCRIEVKVCMPGGLQCVVTVFCHLCVLKCLFIIINVKKTVVYTRVNGALHIENCKNYKKVPLPTSTSPKCQCAVK